MHIGTRFFHIPRLCFTGGALLAVQDRQVWNRTVDGKSGARSIVIRRRVHRSSVKRVPQKEIRAGRAVSWLARIAFRRRCVKLGSLFLLTDR